MLVTQFRVLTLLILITVVQTSSQADDPTLEETPAAEVTQLRQRVHKLEQLIVRLKTERDELTAALRDDAKPLGSVPLADAVSEFNLTHARYPNNEAQPPLTEEEVVAAIRFYHRDSAPVTDSEFDRFKQVAETLKVPRDSRFEVIDTFRGPEYEIRAWSIRLVMPTHNGRRTWAFQIREKMIRSRMLTDTEKEDLVRDAGRF